MYEYQKKDYQFHKDKMKFISRIFPKKPGTILDLGCHTGDLGVFLKEKGFLYHGVDVDKDLIKTAKEKKLKIEYCDLDHDLIPFNKRFDYITAFDIIEHLHNPELAMKKIKAHSKQNTLSLISLPNDFHILNRMRFLFNLPIYPDPFWAHTHLHTFTKKQARNFIKNNDFTILKEYEIPGTFPGFLSFNKRRKLANLFPAFFSRSTLYIIRTK